jgi:carbonic anhydrase
MLSILTLGHTNCNQSTIKIHKFMKDTTQNPQIYERYNTKSTNIFKIQHKIHKYIKDTTQNPQIYKRYNSKSTNI